MKQSKTIQFQSENGLGTLGEDPLASSQAFSMHWAHQWQSLLVKKHLPETTKQQLLIEIL